MPDIAVVIGNYQGDRVLDDCLGSIQAQTRPPVEIIVVDGGSTDGGEVVALSHGARWISEQNGGLGFLYNRGARAAAADFVLLSNNDVAFAPRCFERLHDALHADAALFAADPRQVAWDGATLVHARATLRRGRLVRELLPGFRLNLTAPAASVVSTVSANGGCMLVRRARLLELGGFDETFFMDYEDLDLCWRAWLRGWGSVYVPDAWLRHRVGAVTTQRILPRRLASSHHNLMRFALKCLPARTAATIMLVELLRLMVHPSAVARGLAQLLGELPEVVRLRQDLRPSRALLEWMLEGQPGTAPTAESRGFDG